MPQCADGTAVPVIQTPTKHLAATLFSSQLMFLATLCGLPFGSRLVSGFITFSHILYSNWNRLMCIGESTAANRAQMPLNQRWIYAAVSFRWNLKPLDIVTGNHCRLAYVCQISIRGKGFIRYIKWGNSDSLWNPRDLACPIEFVLGQGGSTVDMTPNLVFRKPWHSAANRLAGKTGWTISTVTMPDCQSGDRELSRYISFGPILWPS